MIIIVALIVLGIGFPLGGAILDWSKGSFRSISFYLRFSAMVGGVCVPILVALIFLARRAK